MKVLIADKFETSGTEGLTNLGCQVTVEPELGPATLIEALARVKPEVLIVRSTKVPAEVVKSCDTLRLIVRAGSGFDNIDYAVAGEHGIAVSNCPGMNAVAVAEAAMGHLINLDRRLPEQDTMLKAGRWNKKEFGKARGLKGMNLLIHGFGAIGREVASRAQAFGMSVSATSRSMTADEAKTLGVTLVDISREEVLRALPSMDAVSVHVPVSSETKGSCDAQFFGAMKDGAYFINTSRGPVVDEAALAAACSSKGIRAGLDVYCDQPGFKDGDWCPDIVMVDGVYCSHHCGASTDQAQLAVADEVVRLVKLLADSGTFDNVINSDHLKQTSTQA